MSLYHRILLFALVLGGVALCGGLLVHYGAPFCSYGSGSEEVQRIAQARWKTRGIEHPDVVVVANDRVGLAALIGDAGIVLSLYGKDRQAWHVLEDHAFEEACYLQARGVSATDAEFLEVHMHRAVPTISFVAPCDTTQR